MLELKQSPIAIEEGFKNHETEGGLHNGKNNKIRR